MSEKFYTSITIYGKKKKHLKKFLNVLNGTDNFITSVKQNYDFEFEKLGVIDALANKFKFSQELKDFLYDCVNSDYMFNYLAKELETSNKGDEYKAVYDAYAKFKSEKSFEGPCYISNRINYYDDNDSFRNAKISLTKIFYAPNPINIYRRGLNIYNDNTELNSLCPMHDWEYDKFGATKIILENNIENLEICKSYCNAHFKEKEFNMSIGLSSYHDDALKFVLFMSRFFEKIIFEVSVSRETKNKARRKMFTRKFEHYIVKNGKMSITEKNICTRTFVARKIDDVEYPEFESDNFKIGYKRVSDAPRFTIKKQDEPKINPFNKEEIEPMTWEE